MDRFRRPASVGLVCLVVTGVAGAARTGPRPMQSAYEYLPFIPIPLVLRYLLTRRLGRVDAVIARLVG
jgi:hypothetical protein